MTMTSTTRRSRTRMLVAALGAAAVVALGGVAFASGDDTPADPADPQPNRVAAAPAAPAAPLVSSPARVVEPEERIDVGGGNSTWLTTEGYHFVQNAAQHGAQFGKAVLFRGFPVGTVDIRAYEGRGSNLYTGAYRGNGVVARVTVEVAGRTLEAKLLTLAGSPGWSAFYVDGPVVPLPQSKWDPPFTAPVKVYAADGTVLASL
ncbi:hypothetical protein ACIBSV_45505 [Embleya sp. NPDC050154]|uniref:hypothetical protein n=1 Tax=Embleya sp. NPDC050154 TaxID=3363988 RepID=UPI0037A5A063